MLQQQPTRALEHLLLKHRLGLALHLPTPIRQLVIKKLDDVKAVEDVEGLGHVVGHGLDMGLRHVGGHGAAALGCLLCHGL